MVDQPEGQDRSQQGPCKNDDSSNDILEKEVNALIDYTAERGLFGSASGNLSQGNLQGQSENASAATRESQLKSTDPLLPALAEAVVDYREAKNGSRDKYRKRLELLRLYSRLIHLTGGQVTGRSLIDCQNIYCHLWPLIIYTVVFLVIVLANEGFNLWLLPDTVVKPEENFPPWLFIFQRYFLDYATPFFWGGLGACVFLLKTLSDKVRERRFDRRELQGWQTRILLGAIFGAVVRYIYDPHAYGAAGLNLDANAVAFLTGFGVKVIYGAIEKTIDQLAEKFNLDAVRKPPATQTLVKQYLESQLAQAESADKRKMLLELIDEIDRPPQP